MGRSHRSQRVFRADHAASDTRVPRPCNDVDDVGLIGAVIDDLVYACTPARHVPVLEIHGLADPAYPFAGGQPTCGTNTTNFNPILMKIAGWGARNGCATTSTVVYTRGKATCKMFDSCPTGAEVTLCTVQDLKHDWAGGTPLGGPCSGLPTTDLNGNEMIWQFFATHPMP